MTQKQLEMATKSAKEETRVALQIVYDNLNQGQQKKILKEDEVKKLFDFYNVQY